MYISAQGVAKYAKTYAIHMMHIYEIINQRKGIKAIVMCGARRRDSPRIAEQNERYERFRKRKIQKH